LGASFSPVHVDDSANLMCSAAVGTGDPAYLSTVQLKRVASKDRSVTLGAENGDPVPGAFSV
jgi:hypothetical protein